MYHKLLNVLKYLISYMNAFSVVVRVRVTKNTDLFINSLTTLKLIVWENRSKINWHQIWLFCFQRSTVNFTYSEHGYSESPVIRNKYFWPEFCPSLFNIKTYGYNEHGYKELLLIRNSYFSPNLEKDTENYTDITYYLWINSVFSFSSVRTKNRLNVLTIARFFLNICILIVYIYYS